MSEINCDLARRFDYGSKNPRKGYRQERAWNSSMRTKYNVPDHIPECQIRRYLEIKAERIEKKIKR